MYMAKWILQFFKIFIKTSPAQKITYQAQISWFIKHFVCLKEKEQKKQKNMLTGKLEISNSQKVTAPFDIALSWSSYIANLWEGSVAQNSRISKIQKINQICINII